jgi:hypothetical protein
MCIYIYIFGRFSSSLAVLVLFGRVLGVAYPKMDREYEKLTKICVPVGRRLGRDWWIYIPQ